MALKGIGILNNMDEPRIEPGAKIGRFLLEGILRATDMQWNLVNTAVSDGCFPITCPNGNSMGNVTPRRNGVTDGI